MSFDSKIAFHPYKPRSNPFLKKSQPRKKRQLRRLSPDVKPNIIIYLLHFVRFTHQGNAIIHIIPVAKATRLDTLQELENLAKLARISAERYMAKRRWFIRPRLSFQVMRATGKSYSMIFRRVRIDRDGTIVRLTTPSKTSPLYNIYHDWTAKQFVATQSDILIEKMIGYDLIYKYNISGYVSGNILRPHAAMIRPFYHVPVEEMGGLVLKR